jgi:hypothetical protein
VKIKAYKIERKTLRTLVEWSLAGIDAMVGREHCSAEDRALIRGFARDLGLLPPENFYRAVRFAGLPVTQIELTEKLASALSPDERRRMEIAIYGNKAKTQAVP